ncbi:hypothetical protein B0T10DRAFT_467519 [Thelonectria olida]|uniref:C2H2-type domain-containing protein n=1 Tax=Thelonectria olida TaxID=1576542 RepID=A0A9P8VNA6_9HYPO|nr:hypothetical protein B0T10DRAFT_467519 [Thelonectria olida]
MLTGHPRTFAITQFLAQQQTKRHRMLRELDRPYQCGWNGCDKSYKTLYHLNAHVAKQSHGQKRDPREFREVRAKSRQRKAKQKALREAKEEHQRQMAVTVAPPVTVCTCGIYMQAADGITTSGFAEDSSFQPMVFPLGSFASIQQPLPEVGGSFDDCSGFRTFDDAATSASHVN